MDGNEEINGILEVTTSKMDRGQIHLDATLRSMKMRGKKSQLMIVGAPSARVLSSVT